VDGVLFVRELAGGHDLVLAFASDGRPAWALDLESGLQWWFPGGESDVVRRAIAESWSSFPTMPIAAASSTGPHPALELGRRSATTEPADGAPAERSTVPSLLWLESAQRRLPERLRPGVAAAIVLGALVVVPILVVLLFGALDGFAKHAVDDPSSSTSAGPTAGATCAVRGAVAHDSAGRVLVCVAESRAMPSVLTWHAST
jgi:hypothetical protein